MATLTTDHPTPAQRTAAGKAARTAAPRSAHGEWEPAASRPDLMGSSTSGKSGSTKELSRQRSVADKALAKARTRDSMQALDKLTEVVDGERRFISDPPLIVPIEELAAPAEAASLTDRMHELLHSYSVSLQSDRRYLLSQFQFVSIARKVVGVGSVGTRPGCSSWWVPTVRTRSSSRPRRPSRRFWPSSWGRASTTTRASGWWPASI